LAAHAIVLQERCNDFPLGDVEAGEKTLGNTEGIIIQVRCAASRKRAEWDKIRLNSRHNPPIKQYR
jgi:hypothetical protein